MKRPTGEAPTFGAIHPEHATRILVAAYGDGDLDVLRYTPAGVLDTSFSSDGKQNMNVNGTDQAESVALDSRGRILVSGSSNGQKDFAVARLLDDGSLDTSFSAGGKQTIDFAGGTTTEIGYAMLVQPDAKVVVAGLSNNNAAVARLSGGDARYYALQDANYNVTATADATGTVLDRFRYDAYGVQEVLNANFSDDLDNRPDIYQPFGFQGLRFDGNSGNLHARNRDLDVSLGRWTQNDPAGYIDGQNLYSFVHESPLEGVDPTGLKDFDYLDPDRTKAGSVATISIELQADNLCNSKVPGTITFTIKADWHGAGEPISNFNLSASQMGEIDIDGNVVRFPRLPRGTEGSQIATTTYTVNLPACPHDRPQVGSGRIKIIDLSRRGRPMPGPDGRPVALSRVSQVYEYHWSYECGYNLAKAWKDPDPARECCYEKQPFKWDVTRVSSNTVIPNL